MKRLCLNVIKLLSANLTSHITKSQLAAIIQLFSRTTHGMYTDDVIRHESFFNPIVTYLNFFVFVKSAVLKTIREVMEKVFVEFRWCASGWRRRLTKLSAKSSRKNVTKINRYRAKKNNNSQNRLVWVPF